MNPHESPEPSMKVPPKRKGNLVTGNLHHWVMSALNESPSEKEGKSWIRFRGDPVLTPLNESPSEKEGK